MSQLQYTIKATLGHPKNDITIAGFSTDESSENIICKHLVNVCKQTNGNFVDTQKLLNSVISNWQQSFSMQSMQTLKAYAGIEKEKIESICLYKNLEDKECLVNRICL